MFVQPPDSPEAAHRPPCPDDFAEREYWGALPQDVRRRDGRPTRGIDLDSNVRRIGVDFQEDVADTYCCAISVRDDDFESIHVGHYVGERRPSQFIFL